MVDPVMCWIASQSKILILGGYDVEEKAARAYDLAALKYWGPSSHVNFPVIIQFSLHFQILWFQGNFFGVLLVLKCNYDVFLVVGKLPKRTWRNEEHD